MKKNKISKNLLNKQRRDIYVRKSKLEGYRSRAVYKLKEIDKKFNIIKNGINIVDLGSAPGSWSQYLSEKSKNSKIMSIDLKEVDKIYNTNAYKLRLVNTPNFIKPFLLRRYLYKNCTPITDLV